MANLEYRVPLTRTSISESGSVAKQFTAAALALLHLEGKLSLDDDVRKHIPELHDFGTPLTIRHLLTHTSGIRDQWALLGIMGRGPGSEVHTQGEILDLAVRQRELNFPVGSEYLYSNMGYVLSTIVVARVSGMPFAKFTEERLFNPLGMRQTQWRDDYRRIVPGRATAYSFERGAWVQDMPFTMVHGNGGLLSSLDDLITWNEALTSGLLGKPELTRMLETPMRLTSGRTITYGLGLQVAPWSAGVREVSHSGATAGYRTWLARYPEARMSVAVWCNASTANAVQLGRQVAAVFLPRQSAARLAPAPIPADVRSRIAGAYRDPRTDSWLSIGIVGEYARVIGPSADSLRPGDTAGSFVTPSGFALTFAPADGKATSLTVRTNDGEVMEMVAMTPIASADVALGDYVGVYRSPELGSSVVMRIDNGRLLARITPDDESTLSPLYADGFRVGASGMTIRFVRTGGRVSGARVFAGRARNVRFDRVE